MIYCSPGEHANSYGGYVFLMSVSLKTAGITNFGVSVINRPFPLGKLE
jgi:hypothetical protein